MDNCPFERKIPRILLSFVKVNFSFASTKRFSFKNYYKNCVNEPHYLVQMLKLIDVIKLLIFHFFHSFFNYIFISDISSIGHCPSFISVLIVVTIHLKCVQCIKASRKLKYNVCLFALTLLS